MTSESPLRLVTKVGLFFIKSSADEVDWAQSDWTDPPSGNASQLLPFHFNTSPVLMVPVFTSLRSFNDATSDLAFQVLIFAWVIFFTWVGTVGSVSVNEVR